MIRIAMIVAMTLLSTTSFARDWSSFSRVSSVQIFDGNLVSFYLTENSSQVLNCQSDLQYFVVDMPSLTYPDTMVAMLLKAHSENIRVAVLPTSGGNCIDGGAFITTLKLED